MIREKHNYQGGKVFGGEKVHAFDDRNDSVLCSAVGTDGTDPFLLIVNHEQGAPFEAYESDPDACKSCVKSWSKLP